MSTIIIIGHQDTGKTMLAHALATANPDTHVIPPDWQAYTGKRSKRFYDIRLRDGREFAYCWPNSDLFHPCAPGVTVTHVQEDEVTHIRECDDEAAYLGTADDETLSEAISKVLEGNLLAGLVLKDPALFFSTPAAYAPAESRRPLGFAQPIPRPLTEDARARIAAAEVKRARKAAAKAPR